MMLFQWIKNGLQSMARYFKLEKNNANNRGHNQSNSDQGIFVDDNLIELEEQNLTMTQDHPLESDHEASAYQIIGGLTALLFSKDNLPRIAAASLLSILGVGLNFLSPYLFGATLQSLSNNNDTALLDGPLMEMEMSQTFLLTLLVSAYTLSQLIPNVREHVIAPVTTRNNQIVTERGVKYLLSQSLDYHVTVPIGKMIYLMQKALSLSTVGNIFLTKIAPTFLEIGSACTILSILYGAEIGLGVLGLLIVYTLYAALTVKPIIKAREDSFQAVNKMWNVIWDDVTRSYRIIKDYGKTEQVIATAHEVFSNVTKIETHATTLPLKIELGHVLQSRILMLIATLYVGMRVQSGHYSVKEFTILATYLNQLCQSLPNFGQALNQFFSLYPDLKYVFSEWQKTDPIIDRYPDVHLLLPYNTAPTIEFDNVSFTYPVKIGEESRPQVFKNLSFAIKAGQKVALVSESGAGKTTLFYLLFRYYQPNSGTIKINGIDISTVSLKSVRESISFFGQNPNLFNGSVRANICYGAKDPDAITDEVIWNLARSVNLYDFLVNLGLDTQTGENGKALSGGQQQKVAVLRGLLKQSSIRLFDEITASFDSKSATQVLQGMSKNSANSTNIMITHKLTEVIDTDMILVIDHGEIIACGTHDELIANCKLYQKLWQSYKLKLAEENTSTFVETSTSVAALSIYSKKTTMLSDSAPNEDSILEEENSL